VWKTADDDRSWIDISHPLDADTPPFPGDLPVELLELDSTDRTIPTGQRHLNCSRFSVSVHCGTHMDAPFHFFAQGQTIDRVAIASCIGPAVLVRISNWPKPGWIESRHFESHRDQIRSARRVIIESGWHRHWKTSDYFTDHPVLEEAAARFLVGHGVVLIGVDFPSVDRPPYPAHDVLLGNGAVIVENLTNLDAIAGDSIELIALPLRLTGRDGSPVRAVARVRSGA
jgi:kynurenine formamidase